MNVPALYATAHRIDDLADTVQARAALIALHLSSVEWHSPAARAFFTHLDDVSGALAGCVAGLHDLADVLRTQAARR